MRLVLIASVVALGACAASPPTGPRPDPIPPEQNQCRASDYQYLVGRQRSEVPTQPVGATWRVTCNSCPVTMDYNPSRLNITYDERTGVIDAVRCG